MTVSYNLLYELQTDNHHRKNAILLTAACLAIVVDCLPLLFPPILPSSGHHLPLSIPRKKNTKSPSTVFWLLRTWRMNGKESRPHLFCSQKIMSKLVRSMLLLTEKCCMFKSNICKRSLQDFKIFIECLQSWYSKLFMKSDIFFLHLLHSYTNVLKSTPNYTGILVA